MTTPEVYFNLAAMCGYWALTLITAPAHSIHYVKEMDYLYGSREVQRALRQFLPIANWVLALHSAIQISIHL